MLNTKTIILIVVGVGLLATLYYMSKRGVQGFQNPSEPTFTMYYAPWCGHCKAAKPEFDEFAKNGHVMIGGTKCVVRSVDPEKQPGEARGKPIRGFPTFLLEKPDGTIVEFKGKRGTDGYLEFLNKQLGGGI